MLVQLRLDGRNVEEDAEELRLLALSAGADVRATIFGSRQVPDAATFVGKGKAEEIRTAVEREQADLIVVNHELSPAQERIPAWVGLIFSPVPWRWSTSRVNTVRSSRVR